MRYFDLFEDLEDRRYHFLSALRDWIRLPNPLSQWDHGEPRHEKVERLSQILLSHEDIANQYNNPCPSIIYRGTSAKYLHEHRPLSSWTKDFKKARYFARSHNYGEYGNPYVVIQEESALLNIFTIIPNVVKHLTRLERHQLISFTYRGEYEILVKNYQPSSAMKVIYSKAGYP